MNMNYYKATAAALVGWGLCAMTARAYLSLAFGSAVGFIIQFNGTARSFQINLGICPQWLVTDVQDGAPFGGAWASPSGLRAGLRSTVQTASVLPPAGRCLSTMVLVILPTGPSPGAT